ncbi:MAG: ABC transporter substrate-binding protein, partial [Deltaproteobacteria bacterium]|nr:ABC transporter substrate-binding protein [Deltaproteobacteria bacterium]
MRFETDRPRRLLLLLARMIIAATAVSACDGRISRSGREANGRPRIISLAPAITETLFALGAGAAVVGVSRYCDYPPEVAKLPKIGTFLTPNIEAIAGLRPTLIIGLEHSSDLREIRALKAMGYRTLMVDDDSIAGIEGSIRTIGDAIGRSREAQALLDQIHLKIGAIEERLGNVPQRRVLMLVGHQPMVAVGRGTYLDELLTLARATNIAAASAQTWPRLSVEYIIATRPEVILDGQMGTDPATPSTFWAKYPSIPAVRDHRVFGYPDDPVLHPGPRIVLTLAMLARMIHPEAFSPESQSSQST